jgi:hypothetical protein
VEELEDAIRALTPKFPVALVMPMVPAEMYSLTCSKDGKVKRVTIGPIDRISLAEARDGARKLSADVTKGADPAGEKALRREQETFGQDLLFRDLCDSFVQDQADDWRPFHTKGLDPAARVEELVKRHGAADMPVWSDAFRRSVEGYSEKAVTTRIQAIVEYLKSVQVK